MKISISGATGFLGHALYSKFNQSRIPVSAIRRFSNKRILKSPKNNNQYFDYKEIECFFRRNRDTNIVIHTATNYGRDIKENKKPASIYWSNVHFPIVLLENAVAHNCELFINIDTFFSTENSQYLHLTNYSLSKKQFREWGNIFGDAGLIRFINIRLFHLYGPGDSNQKFIPEIINNCLLNNNIELTDGLQRRDFIFIDDAVEAIVTIIKAELNKPAGFVNYDLGSGVSTSIRELVETIKKISQSTSELNFGAFKRRVGEFSNSIADIEPLKKLGWSNITNLDDGITATVSYFKRSCDEKS